MPSSNTPCVDGYVTISAPSLLGVLLGLRLQIGEVDRAVGRGRDDDDLHAGHHRRRRVRAVRALRDQAHRAVRVARCALVVAADREQARRTRPARRSSAAATPPRSR